jgi:hypothetical protein
MQPDVWLLKDYQETKAPQVLQGLKGLKGLKVSLIFHPIRMRVRCSGGSTVVWLGSALRQFRFLKTSLAPSRTGIPAAF